MKHLILAMTTMGVLAPAYGIAEEVSPERLEAYVQSCATAMETGNVDVFGNLNVETEVNSETTIIRGFRGIEFPGLVISLIRRFSDQSRMGMCDIAYSPGPDEGETQADVADWANNFLERVVSDPISRPDPNGMGRAILTCIDGVGVSVFVDTENLEQGFNAQIALASRSKIQC